MIVLQVLAIGCRRSAGHTSDFNKVIYAPEHADGFEILGADGRESVLIRSKRPWQGAPEGTSRDFMILRGGENAPKDFDGEIIEKDAERIVCMSSGHIAMLSCLGESNCIVGGSNLNYVTSPDIQSRRSELKEVGHEGAMDYEALIASRPDLVLLYGVNSANPMESKLKELGIPFIYIGDYLEEDPLGKAEWIVAIGECLGRRKDAEENFLPIKHNYNKMKSLADSVSAHSKHPKIMMNIPYGDSWFLPPAGSYMVNLLKDAGGDYLYEKNTSTSSQSISKEEARLLLSKADLWINLGPGISTLTELKQAIPLMSDLNIMSPGKVFNNTLRSNKAGGNDFYESGVVNPDLILRDLIKIMHPEAIAENFTYYLPVTEESAIKDPSGFKRRDSKKTH
ncbi:MAG: ABC transporter substrate-binding protein [Muribaculaceae bacterium]|nr:ABC transporter substrate-binding protein [Muribaculaceae bacterium]